MEGVVNKPIHTLYCGSGIQIAIWQNTENMFSVTCRKNYKDDTGNWASRRSFSQYDLPLLAKGLLDAHSWLYVNRSSGFGTTKLPALPEDGQDAASEKQEDEYAQ